MLCIAALILLQSNSMVLIQFSKSPISYAQRINSKVYIVPQKVFKQPTHVADYIKFEDARNNRDEIINYNY
uniref:Biogenesis of lysosome-related organelles complex 1 subunit 1-like n=1 Tax=Rhizophora mucronata TaxID=61149 RepID=A0A2P2K660_RHIMU